MTDDDCTRFPVSPADELAAITDTYAVVRYSDRWATVGSALFHDLTQARDFAAKLDRARVFRLVEVAP